MKVIGRKETKMGKESSFGPTATFMRDSTRMIAEKERVFLLGATRTHTMYDRVKKKIQSSHV